MASDKPKLTLMNIPLEVRHHIFEYVAVRDVEPKQVLRYWFEKKEVKAKMEELAAKDPNAGAPRIVYAGDQFEREGYEQDDGDDDGEEDGEDGDSDEDSDEEEEGEEETEDEDAVLISAVASNPQAAGQHNAAPAAQSTVSTSAGQILTCANQGLSAALAAANAAIQASIATVAALHTATAAVQPPVISAHAQSPDGDEDEDDDVDMSGDSEDADTDSDDEMAEGDDVDTEAEAVQSSPPAPIITAHRKWRHIPKFVHISHCPPPVELLLASRQLNTEAKSWFYDVAALRVDATGSFAHTSFFEEAFSQITEAAFSPIEDIRKAEVTFVWDTTWLRSEEADCAAAIFPALLRQRAHFVTSILAQAPKLNQVAIHWHDSAQDEEAVELMNDVLIGFLSLNANIKVETHYIAVDAKPHRKSAAGEQRSEFQRIVDNGLDRLF
ncbi:hypothetical protein SVAN01_07737 [Stagonosporopsis vannaccii]|nr:hypothetical protein SVAN01_07737 [Stagonosporopsis vannaccii]